MERDHKNTHMRSRKKYVSKFRDIKHLDTKYTMKGASETQADLHKF